MQARDLFDFPESLTIFTPWFDPDLAPWEWVPRIAEALAAFDFGAPPKRGEIPPGVVLKGKVHLDPTVKLPPRCYIEGPVWIGPEVEIRPNAYIRGNVIVGRGSCLGNSCEYKNCLLMDRVETPHYNYVGDSILGNRAHLGAGAICANLKLARDEVVLRIEGERYRTGLRKLGALMGDGSEAACNSVLQPGTILGRRAAVLGGGFHGYLPAETMAVPETRYRHLPRP